MGRTRLDRAFERRLSGLVNARERGVLTGGLKGVEREALRVRPDGTIAQTPHPAALGSTLTHPHITTDYSEALIELVTPPFPSSWELQQYLCDVHQFVYSELGEELLWATSMPCVLGGDAAIPIARYGSSNIGRMKHVYRVGLGHRYGRMMQAISGVHFNYSFPAGLWPVLEAVNESTLRGQALVDDAYFALLRNYRRYGWLILYLFGVSPAVCRSFFQGRDVPASLQSLGKGTLYAPYATSLRMSDLGYRNKSQAGVHVSVNSLEEYVRDLSRLISTPHPEYQELGVEVDGEWRQLNANLLQIENEYYSFIRPKRVAFSGERPTKALLRAGVQYVELRSLDVGAYDPVGVNQRKLLFLEAFAALCLLRDSAPLSPELSEKYEANHVVVAEPRPRAWARAVDGAGRARARRLGGGDTRPDAGHLRVARRRRGVEALWRGARFPAAEAGGPGRAAVGATARGDEAPGHVVLRARAVDVRDAPRLFPRALSAERRPARGIQGRGRGLARGTACDRGARFAAVRRVRRAIHGRLAGLTRAPST